MKSLSKSLLPFIAAGALSFSPEAAVKAQTPVERPRPTGSTRVISERMVPFLKAESSKLKIPAEMVEQSLKVENPMHVHRAMPESPMVVTDTVGDKRVKLSFGAAGLPEVASRLQEAIRRNTAGQEHGLGIKSSLSSEESRLNKPEQKKIGKKSPWAITTAIEFASKYFDVVSQEINPEPAPRFSGSFSRKLKNSWEVAINLWQSFGHGSNQETGVGVTVSKKGWFGSFTRLFILGGDMLEIKGGKSILIKDRLTVTPTIAVYKGTAKTSPPGGAVGRVDIKPNEIKLGGFELRQNFGFGFDNNLFGLGKGPTGMGFYSPEIAKKVKGGEIYVRTAFSAPIVGNKNTTRRPANGGVNVGYRTTWK